jgi:hypothetical protein
VLSDAGFIEEQTRPALRTPAQLNLFVFPVLIAGANRSSRRRASTTAGRHRHKAGTLTNTPLLFDDSLRA